MTFKSLHPHHNNVNDYIRYDFAEFLDMMQENYYRVTDHELNFGQYAAWGNSHYNFLRFFEKLHRIDPNDQILMEAVVDLKTKWRADIIYIYIKIK